MASPRRRDLSGARTRVRAVVAAVCAFVVWGLVVPAGAAAHASLLFTAPAVGSSVPTAPSALTLIFDQAVTPSPPAIRLSGPAPADAAVGPVARSEGNRVLTAALTRTLNPGVYTVTWQVIADDGDAVLGSYRFVVGTAPLRALPGAPGSSSTGARDVTVALRWVLFLGLSVGLGEAAARRLVRGRVPDNAALPTSWTGPAVAAGCIASLGLAALLVGGGSILRALHDPNFSALDARAGILALLEAAAFGWALALRVSGRGPAWLLLVPVVVAEGLRGHPHDLTSGWGAPVTTIHVAAAALWVGALLYALRAALAWREFPAAARGAIANYARMAAWLVGLVLVTGSVSVLAVTPLDQVVHTGYGRVLIVKLVLVDLALGFALWARTRLRAGLPALSVMRAESASLALILGLSGVLTATQPPRQAGAELPVAPPPIGAVVPVGTRAGAIGMSVAASAGQVVIRLTAPGADAPGADAGYRLSAGLTAPGRGPRPLALRRCGVGCFLAGVDWPAGVSTLTLRAGSRDWPGGDAALTVPWPPRPDPAALAKAVAVLRREAQLTVYERVTSDTASGPGQLISLVRSGAAFADSEPYSGGRATYVNAVDNLDGTHSLLLGFPVDLVEVELVLDADGHLVRETLTAPNHLITRAFVHAEARRVIGKPGTRPPIGAARRSDVPTPR